MEHPKQPNQSSFEAYLGTRSVKTLEPCLEKALQHGIAEGKIILCLTARIMTATPAAASRFRC